MTTDFRMAWLRVALSVLFMASASCALPRGGTGTDAGFIGPDAAADTGSDGGTTCVPADCNDGNACTDDLCTAAGCTQVPNTNSCDDGIYCDGFDTCGDGSCQPGPGNPCTGGTVCDEARHACVGCTMDSDCPLTDTPAWSSCDFGASPCALSGMQTRTVTSYACDTTTAACVATMEPQTQACTRPASETNGLSCSTGPAAGTCVAGSCCTGCLDGSSCVGGTATTACGSAGGTCSSCNDGNALTTDACTAGACTHTCTGCMSGGVCVAGTATSICGSGGGACASCDDGKAYTTDACTGGACTHACTGCTSGGACVAGTATAMCGSAGGACASCNDGNPCTADACSAGACTHAIAADGTACPTGVCATGACVQCLVSADCPDPAASRCESSTHTCGPCGGDPACAHFTSPALPYCWLPAGVCMASCAGGCKHPVYNVCYSGTANTQCGSGGADCVNCTASGQTCTGGTCG